MLLILLATIIIAGLLVANWLLPLLGTIPKCNADFECHFGERRAAPLIRAVEARSAEVPDAITSVSRQSNV